MLFGDTPEEGFVRGRSFLHPALGGGFHGSDGFAIDNSAAAVTANRARAIICGQVSTGVTLNAGSKRLTNTFAAAG